MTDEELLKEMEKRAEAYHNRIKRDFAIAELEKLKEKIDIECDSVDSALDIILDKIAELKGE